MTNLNYIIQKSTSSKELSWNHINAWFALSPRGKKPSNIVISFAVSHAYYHRVREMEIVSILKKADGNNRPMSLVSNWVRSC